MVSLVAPTYSLKGKPHWRRTQQVYALLNQAPPEATYDRLIDYVREKTGKGCSRKLISKWKKLTIHNSANRIQNNGNEQSSNRAVFPEPKSDSPQNPTEKAEPKAKNSHPIQEKVLQVARSTWSYVAATAIVVGLAGCGWFLSKDNSQTAIAQPTSIQNSEFKTQNEQPSIQNPKSKIQNGLPRTIKIHLTLSNPQNLKVKPGDEVTPGTVLSDRTTERQRLLGQKKQLQLSLKKLDVPIPELIPPEPIPALGKLPPVSYQQEEANIALKQQELDEAEKAIATRFAQSQNSKVKSQKEYF